MDTIRTGKVSSVNYDKGKIRVVYSDRDDCVTTELPLMVYNNEYYVPKVDDQVVVLHQPNGAASGFVLGDYWSQTHECHDNRGNGKRVKYFDREGKCYWSYEDTDGDGEGDFSFHNDNKLKFDAKEDTSLDCEQNIKMSAKQAFEISGAEKVKVNSDGSMEITASGSLSIKGSGPVTINGGTVTLSGGVKIDGITFLTHTHECTAPGSPSGPPQGV